MTYLSERERLLIYRGLAIGYNKYEIAKKLGRSYTTIGREIKCNRNNKLKYDSIKAENIYRDSRIITNKAHCKLLNNGILRNEIEIRSKNKEESWFPDNLVGCMK